MLNDASGFRRIYLATGYTDLRRGMEGLASIIKFNFQLDPYQKDILFLFCGRRTDRIKGLVWEGDGFLLLYKRLELGAFNWPRTKEEMLCCDISYGYIFYGETRHRMKVEFTDEVREKVRKIFSEMHKYYEQRYTPKVKTSKKCNACSLKDICIPALNKKKSVSRYIDSIIAVEEKE